MPSALTALSRGGTGHLVATFFVGWVFMYTDRAVFSPVLGVFGSEFDVSPAKLGMLASTFYLVYAAFQIPVGFVAEHIGRRRLLVWGFALFGTSTFFSGLAPTFGVLILLGLVTGIGQATYYPVQYSLAAEMIPPDRRTLALAVVNSGMAVGVAGGTLAAAFVAFGLGLGWRLSLMVMGGLTIAIAFTLGKVVSSSISRPSPTPVKESFRNVLRKDQVAAYLAGFCSLYGFFALLTWLPYYFETSRGFDQLSAGRGIDGSSVELHPCRDLRGVHLGCRSHPSQDRSDHVSHRGGGASPVAFRWYRSSDRLPSHLWGVWEAGKRSIVDRLSSRTYPRQLVCAYVWHVQLRRHARLGARSDHYRRDRRDVR